MPPMAGVRALDGFSPTTIGGGGGGNGIGGERKLLRLLALDGIQDPGNLGTLVRTALALVGWCRFNLD